MAENNVNSSLEINPLERQKKLTVKINKPYVGFYFLAIAFIFTIVAFVYYFLTYKAFGYSQNRWIIALMVIVFWSFNCLLVSSLLSDGRPFWMDIFYVFAVFGLALSTILFLIPCLSPIGIYFTVGNMGDVEANAIGVPRCIKGIIFYVLAIVFVIISAFLGLTASKETRSAFTGGAVMNFLYTFLNVITVIFTLGFAYPLSRLLQLQWKASHTYVDGKRLSFDGDVNEIYGKYVVWVLLSIVTLGIYAVVFLSVHMKRWETENTHFEGEEGKSSFDGDVAGFLGVNIIMFLVSLVTLGVGAFWAYCYRERWFAKHTVINGSRLIFDGTALKFFGTYIKWVLLTIVTVGIYSLWVSVKALDWSVSHTHEEEDELEVQLNENA